MGEIADDMIYTHGFPVACKDCFRAGMRKDGIQKSTAKLTKGDLKMKYPIIHTCEQGSDEWFNIKLGKVSASHFKEILNKKTGRGLYMRRVAGEILTGVRAPAFSNNYMEQGKEKESMSRQVYEIVKNTKVGQIGFYQSSEFVGVSPDGLVGEDGLIEIKAPLASTHIQYLIDNKLPSGYIPQVQGQLWATGRQWTDFVSYEPDMKHRPFHCVRIKRDEDYISELAKAVNKFVSELKEIIEKIKLPF